jgi:glycopeptide antibiotics resistance protein
MLEPQSIDTELQLPKLWFTLAYSITLVVGVLSLIPGPDIGGSDKLVHFLTYAILSAGFSLIVEQQRSLWLILFGLIAYGLLLEFLQGLTGYRFEDMADALANSLGVITGLGFYFSPLRDILRRFERWLLSRR